MDTKKSANDGAGTSGDFSKRPFFMSSDDPVEHEQAFPEPGKDSVDGFFYCVCTKKFSTRAKLLAHVQKLTIEFAPKLFCCFCEAKFFDARALAKHMERRHEQVTVEMGLLRICQECGKGFRTIRKLREHEDEHTQVLSLTNGDIGGDQASSNGDHEGDQASSNGETSGNAN